MSSLPWLKNISETGHLFVTIKSNTKDFSSQKLLHCVLNYCRNAQIEIEQLSRSCWKGPRDGGMWDGVEGGG